VVVAIDLGTTTVKAFAVTADGRTRARHARPHPLAEPRPGAAVQDPDVVEAIALDVARAAIAEARTAGDVIVALSFSAALHSIVPIDEHGRPLSPALTWADTRAVDEALALRADPAARAVAARTGTPLHPMSPLVKLRWFARHRPDLFASAHRWVGLKDVVLARWCDEWLVDRSVASATGLMDLSTQQWSPDALALAGVSSDRLPTLVSPTSTVPLSARARVALGLDDAPPVVVVAGAGDGPLANAGLGVLDARAAACSIGTSGAVRLTVPAPVFERDEGEFCYLLDADHFVLGAAVNSGGVVLDWVRDALGPRSGGGTGAAPLWTTAAMLGEAARVATGSEGLVMLPSLLHERAPGRDPRATGAFVGLTRRHTRAHLARAALEGVAAQLASVLDGVVRDRPIHDLRVTGGLTRHPLVRQVLADTTGRVVIAPKRSEASAIGAAMLAWVALGEHPTLEAAAAVLGGEVVVHRPDPEASSLLRSRLPLVEALDAALAPFTIALAGEEAVTR
jgi:gluconokinase